MMQLMEPYTEDEMYAYMQVAQNHVTPLKYFVYTMHTPFPLIVSISFCFIPLAYLINKY